MGGAGRIVGALPPFIHSPPTINFIVDTGKRTVGGGFIKGGGTLFACSTGLTQVIHRVTHTRMTHFLPYLLGLVCFLAFFAVGVAVMALRKAETVRIVQLERRLDGLELRTEAAVNDYQSVRDTVRRINSRVAMREKRDRDRRDDAEEPDPDKDPRAWKQAMQLKYPRGALSGR